MVAFFRSHAAIAGPKARSLKAARNAVLDAFRGALSAAERREFVELAQAAKELGVYDRAVAAFEGTVATARDASKSSKSRKKKI